MGIENKVIEEEKEESDENEKEYESKIAKDETEKEQQDKESRFSEKEIGQRIDGSSNLETEKNSQESEENIVEDNKDISVEEPRDDEVVVVSVDQKVFDPLEKERVEAMKGDVVDEELSQEKKKEIVSTDDVDASPSIDVHAKNIIHSTNEKNEILIASNINEGQDLITATSGVFSMTEDMDNKTREESLLVTDKEKKEITSSEKNKGELDKPTVAATESEEEVCLKKEIMNEDVSTEKEQRDLDEKDQDMKEDEKESEESPIQTKFEHEGDDENEAIKNKDNDNEKDRTSKIDKTESVLPDTAF